MYVHSYMHYVQRGTFVSIYEKTNKTYIEKSGTKIPKLL